MRKEELSEMIIMEEVRHKGYGPLERVADHIKLTKKIIGALVGTQTSRKSRGKLPDETYFREDRAFVDAVVGNGEALVSRKEGLRVLEVLEAIKESVDGGKVVDVKMHDL